VPLDVRRLHADDVTTGFKSGNHHLDAFLKRHALRNMRANASATFVAVEGTVIVGFVTVVPGTASSNALRALLPDLPPYPTAPVLLLGRMATDKRWQGRGIGRLLLETAYAAARHQAALGCVGIATDAKPGAVAFYEHAGFHTLELPTAPEATTSMFLPLGQVPPEVASPPSPSSQRADE
jgi:GNAT superfamily N-acetyltransferase